MRSSIHIAIAVLAVHAAACSSRSSPATGGRSATGTARLAAGGRDQVTRLGHAAALLGDGRVLLAGGWDGAGPTTSAAIFDPATGQFQPTPGTLLHARVHATATALQNGRVLVVGGDDGAGNALSTAELFDPSTGQFTDAGSLTTARTLHSATRVGDTVVVIGGIGGGLALDSAERYTPGATPAWSTLAPIGTARARHTATLLSTGKILVAGGEDAAGAPVADGADGWAELYDPASTGAAASTGGAVPGRSRHAAALLTNGTVLLTGGRDAGADLGTWIVYDPTAGAFTAGTGAVSARSEATASLLPDGRVIVAGGAAGGTASSDVDIYSPTAASVTLAGSGGGHLVTARAGHAALVLASGRVLLTGGGLDRAELLDRAVDHWDATVPSGYLIRAGHTATLLPTGTYAARSLSLAGKVLVVGGGVPGRPAYDKSCQIYDPEARTLTAAPDLGNARAYHTTTVLANGAVLVAGGNAGLSSRNDAELWSGGASWTPVAAKMIAARSNHTATLLGNGKVLLTGGLDENSSPLASAELFDPAGPSFTRTSMDMSAPRAHHAATLLPDGKVLVAGGDGTASADVYDPGTDTFTRVGDLSSVRAHFTATPLAGGRVLLTGGTSGAGELSSSELFDGAGFVAIAGDVSSGTSLTGRYDQAAALLPAGEVLVVSGQNASGFDGAVERYEPASESFVKALVSSLAQGRDWHTATQLPSGQILVWGGDDGFSSAGPQVYDAFYPPAPNPPDVSSTLASGLPFASGVPDGFLELQLASGSFTGGTTGDTRSAEVNQPVFVITRQDGDGIAYARAVRFDAASARVQLPSDAPQGWWWLRAIVGGVPGRAVPFKMLDPFRLSPEKPSVPPRATLTFAAAGGNSASYTWTEVALHSSDPADAVPGLASITTVGAYQAGANPSDVDPAVDTVQCADFDGNTISTDITVGPRISVTPDGPQGVAPSQSITFVPRGGCDPAVPAYTGLCTGYTLRWRDGDASNNHSGATLSGFTYTAGPTGGQTDQLQLVDNLGNHLEISVTVTEKLEIVPTAITVIPLGTTTFTAQGGCNPARYGELCQPYKFEIVSRGSGAEASIDGAGVYHAGRVGSTPAGTVTDLIRVTDSLGSTAEAVVTLDLMVAITPDAPTTPPGGSLSFTAAHGNGTFTGCPGGSCWTFVTRASGADAVLDASGNYTAGHTPNVTDVIQVQDTLGNVATVSVAVGPGISISPAEAGAYPNQTVTLTASGGQGSGFHWQLTSTGSGAGAAIAPVAGTNTALYTAGPNRGATDILQVTDDLGNQATADLVVWPDWKPSGSGCSSGGGSGGALALVLMALWLARRGRPRARAASPIRARGAARRFGTGALLLLAAASARAQTPPVTQSFVVERFQPAGGAFDLLGVQSAQTAGPLQKTFRLYVNYASRPLVLIAPGMHKVALLKSQLGADLTGSVGIGEWAEVSLAVPFMLSQSREQDRYLPPELRQKVASSGLGDPRLTPKVRLLDAGRFRLGLSAPVGLPLGDRKAYLGHGGITFAPTALGEVDGLGPARLLLNAGAVFRPERRLVDLTVGNAYTYGAGLEYPFTLSDSHLAALTTLAGEVGMKHSATSSPMEVLGGVRWSAPSGLLVSAGGGPGIGKGYGTPQYRVFLELGYTSAPADRLQETPRPKEEPKPEPKAEEPKPEPTPEAKAEEPKAEEPKPAEPPKAEEPKPEEPKPAAKPHEPAAEPEVVLRIDAQVFFDFNKKEIKDEYKPLLRRVAKRILSEPRMRVIRIEGHADDLGPPDYNLWLSEERARAVKEFLEKNGVPPSRFAVIGFGKTKPTKPGRSSDARAKNRRVEFDVQEY